ncbi:MAG: hypothetical protein E7579_04355 [Ruminococcaceae bacterium]|nr:hypothetical protein [Oscillospiraceae bacterium]
MGKPVIIDSDVLRYLVQEHLALVKEVEIEAKATIIACEHCAYQIENFAECETAGGVCDSCKVRGTCPCNGCGGDSKNFEWRGVVEENEPDEEEVTEFMKMLIETKA